MNATRGMLIILAGFLGAACSRTPDPTPQLDPDAWIQFAYFTVFDPISETHISRTLKSLGIEWRGGKQGWRGSYIDIRDRDKARATAALEGDVKAGSIDGLVGIYCPEPRPESIRRPVAEFLKSERFSGGTLEGRAIRHEAFMEAIQHFPNVESYTARFRSHVDEDNRRRTGVEIKVALVVDLEKKVAGKTLDFKIYKDGESIEVDESGEWWQGGEQSEKELRRRAKARPN